MEPIVIIGSGLAGYGLAREFRKLDQSTPLTIITRDPGRQYSKPMLSNALTRGQTPEQLATFSADQVAEQLNATVIADTYVESISLDKKTVNTAKETIAYDKLVLASGARVITPKLAGNAVDQMVSVNSLVDYEVFREMLIGKKHIAIVGAGLIGCEFANDLLNGGFQVDVASFEPWPLYRFLPQQVGELVQEELAKAGVRWHMNSAVEAVDEAGEQFQLTLSTGEKIQADLVLSAIGIVPDLRLASDAGLTTNKGIVTDEFLQTSQQDVFALGDCVEVSGLVLPYVMPLMHGARVLAKTLAGDKTKLQYPCMPVVVKTSSYPVVVSPLMSDVQGEWQIDIDENGAKAVFNDESGQLQSFVLTDKKVSERLALSKQINNWL